MASQNRILSKIKSCTGCPLYNNQTPLLDNKSEADIIWVGLSAVKVNCTKKDTPLSAITNSGKLIAQIEQKSKRAEFYKTNLVKCLPLDNGKIRYPKKNEMQSCCKHLKSEVSALQPKLVFLLGKQVGDFVTDNKGIKYSENFEYEHYMKDGTIYVPVHHPSYILVYKRKQIESYINGISKIINQFMRNSLQPSNLKVA